MSQASQISIKGMDNGHGVETRPEQPPMDCQILGLYLISGSGRILTKNRISGYPESGFIRPDIWNPASQNLAGSRYWHKFHRK